MALEDQVLKQFFPQLLAATAEAAAVALTCQSLGDQPALARGARWVITEEIQPFAQHEVQGGHR